MSFQAQPQQQQPQQPVQVYPDTVTNEPPSHHSNGSFGTVFIVLAVIVVISAIACFLGRLCNKKSQNHHHSGGQKPAKQQKQVHSVRPRDVGSGDIELGFDKRLPSAKPIGHGHGQGPIGHSHGQGPIGHSHGQGPNGHVHVHVPNGDGHGPYGHDHGHGGGRGPKPQAAINGDMMHKGFEMKLGKNGELRSGV